MALLEVPYSFFQFSISSLKDESNRVTGQLTSEEGHPCKTNQVRKTHSEFRHLSPLSAFLSRDPSFAFTAGQWMTEVCSPGFPLRHALDGPHKRPGGSDISQTETIATPTGETRPWGAVYKLDGFKWFSSATDSDVALALARTGSPDEGSRSLSLFLVPLRLPLIGGDSVPPPSPISNNIFVHRLKNKIGTHILPTAELSLESTEAYLLGTINQGVKSIASVLNITRIHSAIASIGNLRKCLAIAVSYSTVRKIGGGKQLLRDAPIHVSQLAYISLTYRALTHLIFGAVGLLGKVEFGAAAKEEQDRLRLLTPTVKAFAAEKACTAMEEAMAALGGAGYMEENGIGRSIRDSLVEKIWEGTTTVLALDLVRAAKDSTALTSFINVRSYYLDLTVARVFIAVGTKGNLVLLAIASGTPRRAAQSPRKWDSYTLHGV